MYVFCSLLGNMPRDKAASMDELDRTDFASCSARR